MKNLRDRPIRQKITAVIMLISSVVLLLACAALFGFQAYSLKQHSTHELAVIGRITAHNIAAAVMFKDEDAAEATLSGLKVMPQIVTARLELTNGQRLAYFGDHSDDLEIRGARLESGFRINGHRILLAQPVVRDGKREGTVYLVADLQAMSAQLLKLYAGIFALVLTASLLLAFALSRRFQRFITTPILHLSDVAHTIANQKDYSVRARKVYGDEVGVLTDSFNQMLTQIQSQDSALQRAQRELKEQVGVLQREISDRKRAEASQERLTAILEATPDIVISADPHGNAFYLNHAARNAFGLTDKTDVGTVKTFDVHPNWARDVISSEGLPTALQEGSWAGETAILDGEGREVHVSQVLIAHRGLHGEVEFFSTVMRDMTERREAEEALKNSQQKLLQTSRLAGMAEVATGVLHNVGNVLNSVNVSAGLVVEKLRRSKAPKLAKAAALLTEHNGHLGEYLTNDPNGQKLPGYLAKLGEFFVAENTELLEEVDQLGRNIEHIKEVVAMQQSYAKVSGVFENLPAHRLVEDAIAMNIGAFERHGVTLEQNISSAPLVRVDRHKVLQILINLIRNAKYALDEVQRTDKRITISVFAVNEKAVHIVVADNGIGISPENLTRIFNHGFTTREDGHGFGLHSGANAAHSMGGSLSVTSAGIGEGATFTLELPIASSTTDA
jgi:PAS domain S-box-containing protein